MRTMNSARNAQLRMQDHQIVSRHPTGTRLRWIALDRTAMAAILNHLTGSFPRIDDHLHPTMASSARNLIKDPCHPHPCHTPKHPHTNHTFHLAPRRRIIRLLTCLLHHHPLHRKASTPRSTHMPRYDTHPTVPNTKEHPLRIRRLKYLSNEVVTPSLL